MARLRVKMGLPLGKNNMFQRKGCSRSSLARFLHFGALVCVMAGLFYKKSKYSAFIGVSAPPGSEMLLFAIYFNDAENDTIATKTK